MVKEKVRKIVGYVDLEKVENASGIDLINDKKSIILDQGLYIHISKHAEEYASIDSLTYTMCHIEEVITNHDFIFYNEEQCSLEYYKKLIENVCVVVKLTNKRELFIHSIFPVTVTKIDNRKNKVALENNPYNLYLIK